MTNTLPVSSRGSLSLQIYVRLLLLYPEDLRRDHAADMALVFAEDLDAARREAGMRGLIRIWWCTLVEFLRFALPGLASSPAARVPGVWFALSTAIMSVEMAMAVHHTPAVMTPFHAVCGALLLPALTTPGMALFSMWACRGGALISLDLAGKMGEDH
jgi:hypothetical protein